MDSTRKTALAREKELRLAIFRIEQGRAHSNAKNVSIASVAREAGVTPALIHNHYPTVAETIRVKQGASSRAKRDAKQDELRAERELTKKLRHELKNAHQKIAQLASINETLIVENQILKARLTAPNVTAIKKAL